MLRYAHLEDKNRQKHRNTKETEKLPTNKQTRPEQRNRKSADGAILKCK